MIQVNLSRHLICECALLQYLIGSFSLTLLSIVVLLAQLDRRKRRPLSRLPPVSFIVPCYNAAETVARTIRSIHAIAGSVDPDIVVVDDKSTDNTLEVLRSLLRDVPFRLVENDANLGKSQTLNINVARARHGVIFFVDADVIANEDAFHDALARLQGPGVGAVSCPYEPDNQGFWPLMQHIEYNMQALIQGSYNVFSAMSLWGGFLAVRKDAFEDAGGFSPNAITEDMELAFKLIETGWRVEQSFVRIRTRVPNTAGSWSRQKLRWSAGAIQALFWHCNVWIRNPVHMLLMLSLVDMIALSLVSMAQNFKVWHNLFDYYSLVTQTVSLSAGLELTSLVYGAHVLDEGLWMLALTLFALPYVLPLVTGTNKLHLCLLVVPFSIVYFPLYSVVFISSVLLLVHKANRLRRGARVW